MKISYDKLWQLMSNNKMKGARKENLMGILDKETDGLVIDKMINFGAFDLKKTVCADSPDFTKTISNLIDYALIRNQFTEIFKLT